MKTKRFVLMVLAGVAFAITNLLADTLSFQGGDQISGTIIQTNGDDVLLLVPNAAFNFSKSKLREIKVEPDQTLEVSQDNNIRLPTFAKAVVLLSKQTWATNLTPIPATVIDKGVLRNVPYNSFRCGEDYELNVYGDPAHPAGIEIGIYRGLLTNSAAKMDCLNFIEVLLKSQEDKDFLKTLSLKTDYKIRDDLSFEITPPTDMDAYNGWWVSVYSEEELSHARASDEELKQISIRKTDIASQPDNAGGASVWTGNDLKLARVSQPTRITFVNPSSGLLITNAQVVRVVDGVSLIYQTGPSSGGMVRLADLPEDLRNEYGYNAEKTKAADAKAKQEKDRLKRELDTAEAATQASASLAARYASLYPQYYQINDYSSDRYSSGGGSVYVNGYYRKNGTYVHGYYRRR
jgi:hypothetical protein